MIHAVAAFSSAQLADAMIELFGEDTAREHANTVRNQGLTLRPFVLSRPAVMFTMPLEATVLRTLAQNDELWQYTRAAGLHCIGPMAVETVYDLCEELNRRRDEARAAIAAADTRAARALEEEDLPKPMMTPVASPFMFPPPMMWMPPPPPPFHFFPPLHHMGHFFPPPDAAHDSVIRPPSPSPEHSLPPPSSSPSPEPSLPPSSSPSPSPSPEPSLPPSSSSSSSPPPLPKVTTRARPHMMVRLSNGYHRTRKCLWGNDCEHPNAPVCHYRGCTSQIQSHKLRDSAFTSLYYAKNGRPSFVPSICRWFRRSRQIT